MLEPLRCFLVDGPQARALGAAHLIHRLIQMARDMESVQHVQSLTGFGRDDFQVGLPHVTAHKAQPFDDLRPQCLQTPTQRGLRTTTSHPQQTPASGVDLVDHSQEVVCLQTASPMNFVHADGFDTAQLAVRQTPLDKPPHRPIHRLPTGLERSRRFPPTQPSRPARQESHHGARHRALAVAPRNVLDYDPMLGTLHAPWRVAKVGGDSPQRHEEPASPGQAVIARRRFLTTRAAPAYTRMRLYGDLDRLRSLRAAKHSDPLVYEPDETLHLIQDGLNL